MELSLYVAKNYGENMGRVPRKPGEVPGEYKKRIVEMELSHFVAKKYRENTGKVPRKPREVPGT